MTPATFSKSSSSIPCELHGRRVRASVDLPALSEVFARQKFPSILGGNAAIADTGGFSYWAADPKAVFEFRAGQTEPFVKLQKLLAKYKVGDCQHAATEMPEGDIFHGGWIGYFSYDLARYIEKLPVTAVDDIGMPLIRLCFYDRLIAYDHAGRDFWLFVLELPGDIERPSDKLSHLERLLAEAQVVRVAPPLPGELESIDFSRLRCNMTKDYYLSTVRKIKRYIFDGDVYQINFSQRFEYDYNARPIDLYHWQNKFNPSGYAAYIDAGDSFIVSASPEMFIKIAGGVIRTKPIKGTRPRLSEATDAGLDAQCINAQNFDELLHSAKEQAELNMIIDLERNDVARICIPGTREVIQPRTIETYPTVFHAVATVAGRLRKDVTFCDVLKAMFPGGSITGAPKIRSMETIDETEPTARGVYTGAIGFIGLDGNAALNIAIRTIIIKDQRAFAQTGGGIVADSDAEAEWQETITKARALLAGIRATENTKDKLLQPQRTQSSQR